VILHCLIIPIRGLNLAHYLGRPCATCVKLLCGPMMASKADVERLEGRLDELQQAMRAQTALLQTLAGAQPAGEGHLDLVGAPPDAQRSPERPSHENASSRVAAPTGSI
jgi:hypothetical protein